MQQAAHLGDQNPHKKFSVYEASLGHLLEVKHYQLVIPSYQRPYEWKSTDVQLLLHDLKNSQKNPVPADRYLLLGSRLDGWSSITWSCLCICTHKMACKSACCVPDLLPVLLQSHLAMQTLLSSMFMPLVNAPFAGVGYFMLYLLNVSVSALYRSIW